MVAAVVVAAGAEAFDRVDCIEHGPSLDRQDAGGEVGVQGLARTALPVEALGGLETPIIPVGHRIGVGLTRQQRAEQQRGEDQG